MTTASSRAKPRPAKNGRLRLSMCSGASLSAAELDELWALRRDLVEFGPGQDLELDRAKIGARLAQATLVCAMRDRAGALQGMWMVNEVQTAIDGRAHTVFFVDQWFVREAYRGDPVNSLSILRYALRALPRYPRSRWYIAGIAGPLSYVFLHRWLEQLWVPQQPELPERERQLFGALLRDVPLGSADDPHLVPTLALMPVIPGYLYEREDLRHTLERYERYNPRWREGWAVPMLGAVNLRMLRPLLRRTFRRAISKRR